MLIENNQQAIGMPFLAVFSTLCFSMLCFAGNNQTFPGKATHKRQLVHSTQRAKKNIPSKSSKADHAAQPPAELHILAKEKLHKNCNNFRFMSFSRREAWLAHLRQAITLHPCLDELPIAYAESALSMLPHINPAHIAQTASSEHSWLLTGFNALLMLFNQNKLSPDLVSAFDQLVDWARDNSNKLHARTRILFNYFVQIHTQLRNHDDVFAATNIFFDQTITTKFDPDRHRRSSARLAYDLKRQQDTLRFLNQARHNNVVLTAIEGCAYRYSDLACNTHPQRKPLDSNNHQILTALALKYPRLNHRYSLLCKDMLQETSNDL